MSDNAKEGVPEAMPHPDFEAFASALRAEFEQKRTREREKLEQYLADRISDRRYAVEQQVARMRAAHAQELERRIGAMRRILASEMRERIVSFAAEVMAEAEKKIPVRLAALGAEERKALVRTLLLEAQVMVGGSCVAVVPPECSTNEPLSGFEAVEPTLEDPWGGCVVFDAATRRRFAVNTIRKRWERCLDQRLTWLGQEVLSLLDATERSIGELRLS